MHQAAPDDLIPDVLERRVVGGRQGAHDGFGHAFQAISGRVSASRVRGPCQTGAMDLPVPDIVLITALSITVFGALCTALVLTMLNLRTPRTAPLAVAAGLLVLAVVVVSVTPVGVPALLGAIIALLAVAVAVFGGNPITRRVLDIATGGRVRETADGGILLPARRDPAAAAGEMEPLLRGGTTIGYLERLAVAVGVIAGYPEAIAVIVAIKGIGRFSELAAAEARERFIIGTLASLVWACVCGAIVRLALW